MRIFFRTILFSITLLVILSFASYRLYRSQSQIEARWQRVLDSIVSTPVKLSGCVDSLFGDLTLERLEIPAAPVLLERRVLELEGLRFADPNTRRMFRSRTGAEPSVERPTLQIQNATVWLDHEVAGPAGAEVERWNVSDLVSPQAIAELLEARHAQVLIHALSVRLRDQRPTREEFKARIDFRDVEIRYADPNRVALEADLAEGESWGGGELLLSWGKTGWNLRASIEDLRVVERVQDLWPEPMQRLWNHFRPSGSWNVDLRDFSLRSGAQVDFEAWVNHYDTSLKLGRSGLSLHRLNGRMKITPGRISLADASSAEVVRAELLGAPVLVSGAAEGDSGELTLRLQSGTMDRFIDEVVVREEQPLKALIALLRPAGGLSGALSYRFSSKAADTLEGELKVSGGAFDGTPFLRQLEGGIRFKRSPDENGGSLGSGKLEIKSAEIAGLGRASGEVSFDWSGGGFHFKCSDLKVEKRQPAGAGTGLRPERQDGSVIVEGHWSAKRGLESLEIRCLGVPLALESLQASDMQGELKYSGGTEPSRGRMELGPVTLRQGILAKELPALLFSSGDVRLRFESDSRQLLVRSFKLSGEGRVLRAVGTVDLLGEVSLVVFLDEGPSGAGVLRLPEDSGPAEWKAAARGSYRAFRLTGPMGALESREITGLDSAFVPAK